jgi:hypothetical protein
MHEMYWLSLTRHKSIPSSTIGPFCPSSSEIELPLIDFRNWTTTEKETADLRHQTGSTLMKKTTTQVEKQ